MTVKYKEEIKKATQELADARAAVVAARDAVAAARIKEYPLKFCQHYSKKGDLTFKVGDRDVYYKPHDKGVAVGDTILDSGELFVDFIHEPCTFAPYRTSLEYLIEDATRYYTDVDE